MNIKLNIVDYQDSKQGRELIELLNIYALDKMGGGESLSSFVKENLVSELSKTPNAFSIICYAKEKAVGLINCFQGFSTFKCKPLINIHDVIVLKEYRGLGLSHEMIKKVEEVAIERGCCKLTLEVLTNNDIAKSSYRKLGFEDYELDPKSGKAMFWHKAL
ncbi:MAG: GNAT family N-acetyltransferase [Woeseiaceae bacterium]